MRLTKTSDNLQGRPVLTGFCKNVAFQENTVVDCQNVLSVAVTRDEVGVLDINFQGQFQYSRPGLWYRFIQVETDNLELCVSTKNIIMDVELASIYAPFWNPYWNYQFLSQPEVRAWYARDCQTSLPQRMRYVELNDDIQGIIVGCCIDGFASLETYDGSGKPHSSARAMDKFSTRTTYIRFPLAQGEFITAAWIREPTDNSSFRQSILVLSTSFQRTCTFGHYVPREDESRYRYEPLVEHNTHQITGFCYNDNGNSSSRQKYIGVTHDEKPIEPLPDPPWQAAFTPPNHWIPQWFMSSACLAGAIRVQTFVNNKESHRPTMGMLLSYESHQESIGQYRFDWDVEDLDVTAPMYFFSGDTKFGPYVKVICNGEEKPDWKKIPRTARLVWWFTAVCSDLDVLTT
ncbi:hypothetical protein COCMIDRAFT_36123 [Bipolaris oryzae ATCC 44560]|uniref:Uncharacterized protein n=1 Tax=Bipolaris oryzae ATCC 44560 TaxID=930090 RepID=W6Z8R6_COCMI|nr:uncharacterized protein COCMIDRAFT_36123 [Bipolaris oryzae ATCC 44560]EUC46163.1 hypothetical protein COCMIDRAFT_36123 [Bipolaris oryzae ATCC 44560]